MGKKRPKKRAPIPGDVFAIALEGGRFAACRVLAVGDRADRLLVANCDWNGQQAPDIQEPALRSVLRLTHHAWKGKPSATWVNDAPPKEFILIGNITPEPSEAEIPNPGGGSWAFFRIQPRKQWLWDHPEDEPPPPPPPSGRFVLHRFNGDELYQLESAVIRAYESDGGITVWFEVKADTKNAQRYEDTAEMGMAPHAEVGIKLPRLDASAIVGQELILEGTKSDDEDSCMSLLYYCEHEPLRNNRIRVVSREGNRFWLHWTATACDVNYYDGSKPPTQVEIEGEFVFRDIDKWLPS